VSLGLFDPDINPISRVSNIVGHRNGGIFAQAIEDPVEFVNLLAGTFTDGRCEHIYIFNDIHLQPIDSFVLFFNLYLYFYFLYHSIRDISQGNSQREIRCR
jgi:hypothetical protein